MPLPKSRAHESEKRKAKEMPQAQRNGILRCSLLPRVWATIEVTVFAGGGVLLRNRSRNPQQRVTGTSARYGTARNLLPKYLSTFGALGLRGGVEHLEIVTLRPAEGPYTITEPTGLHVFLDEPGDRTPLR